MPHPKPWPASESEYVMPEPMLKSAILEVRHGRAGRDMAFDYLQRHTTATSALDNLRTVAERYYTAAGFRE